MQAFRRALALIETNHGTHRGWVRHLLGQLEGVAGPRDRFRRLVPQQVGRVVFVCLGNINRSAFAHAVATRTSVACASLGLSTTTGAPATAMACAVAQEMGYALEHHSATDLKDHEPRDDDLLLVMELRHAHRLVAHGFPAERIALLGHWARPVRYHLHDPEKLSRDYYRTCFTLIESAVRNLLGELEQGNSPSVRR